jgi:hypothetical protein
MAHNYWLPTREQDLADLAVIWKEDLSDTAKQTAFGWDARDCAATTDKVDGFLEKRAAHRETSRRRSGF